jgi:hypothetical protein
LIFSSSWNYPFIRVLLVCGYRSIGVHEIQGGTVKFLTKRKNELDVHLCFDL